MKDIFDRLFPVKVDNNYTGYPIAKWVFLIIIIPSVIRSLIHMFAPDSGAQSIATIPLDTFTQNGANSVILMLALWGSAQFLMSIVYIVVLWRYKSLIPLMYILMFLEYSLRMFLMHIKPIHISGTAPGHVIDYALVPLSLIMFFLSIAKAKSKLNI